MPEVQAVFEKYGSYYCQNHKLSHTQHKAMNAILNCRTSRLGGHMDNCPNCGYTKPSYNSCRNRHCPKCQTLSKERWIDARKADLLDIGYFHVVFTVPQELNPLIYSNQQNCYSLLFRCVAETLQELASDKKYLGAAIGHTAVLHTWGQNLCFHPHIHCIVPSGGLTTLGKWQPSRKKFFLPVKVLSRKFRGKFLALLKQQIQDVDQALLSICYNKEWVVYSCRISSCFFSSRENIRISAIWVERKRFNTAPPKDPVPPVIRRVLFVNMFTSFYCKFTVENTAANHVIGDYDYFRLKTGLP